MAEIKDKLVTTEALSALHEHSKSVYMTNINPTGGGDLSIDGDGWFTGGVYIGGTSKDNAINIVDLIYPVGSVYIATNAANPSVLFGGTWKQIQDTFLLGAGNIYTAGSTGGEATHTLTVNEMPSHSHGLYNPNEKGEDTRYTISVNDTKGLAIALQTGASGGDQPHNNMPPYLAVYIWERIA